MHAGQAKRTDIHHFTIWLYSKVFYTMVSWHLPTFCNRYQDMRDEVLWLAPKGSQFNLQCARNINNIL